MSDLWAKPFDELTDEELAQVDARDWTAEEIMRAIRLALTDRNMQAVVSLLRRLAMKDPQAAATILAVIEPTP